jgi:hypothetical protein
MKPMTIVMVAGLAAGGAFGQTVEASKMVPAGGAVITPLITVGETVDDGAGGSYLMRGIPDGIGAYELDQDTVRFFVNHEFGRTANVPGLGTVAIGGQWTANAGGLQVQGGARVSWFDIDKATRQITRGGNAMQEIIGLDGSPMAGSFEGFNRFCSSSMAVPSEGLADVVYLMGEETGGGVEYCIDPATLRAYALGDWGKAAWENVSILPSMGTAADGYSVFIIGDDRGDAPLLVYAAPKVAGGSFLERNGLVGGQVYAWKSDTGEVGPRDFKGTGNALAGRFVKIDTTGVDTTNPGDLDAFGFATQGYQDAQYGAKGVFRFSRPEDVAYDALNPTSGRAVMASTGRITNFSDDAWGTVYIADLDFDAFAAGMPEEIPATVEILYDGNDAGNRDYGIRSPDNLDWADDGWIYINEDRSVGGFGAVTGRDALIWRISPNGGVPQLVAEMDQFAVPSTFVYDSAAASLGTWESSGILDVSSLFGEEPGSLFLFDVQAHGTLWSTFLDGTPQGIADALEIVEGGQVSFLDMTGYEPCVADFAVPAALLSVADLNAYAAAFQANDPSADLAAPFGEFTIADINAFLAAFAGGCR